MNALRAASGYSRKLCIRFFILPYPPESLRWIPSEMREVPQHSA